jgi:hypothetical protein
VTATDQRCPQRQPFARQHLARIITHFPYQLHLGNERGSLENRPFRQQGLIQEAWFEAGYLLGEKVYAVGSIRLSPIDKQKIFTVAEFAVAMNQDGKLVSILGLQYLKTSYQDEIQTWNTLAICPEIEYFHPCSVDVGFAQVKP